MRTRTICLVAGCPEFAVRNGRCPGHQLRRMGGRRWRRIVAQVVARDEGRCWLCGGPGATSADHVVRVRDGGEDSIANLRAAHIGCNRRRC